MNRQTKRMMERQQGASESVSAAAAARQQVASRNSKADKRLTFRGYLSEVKSELKKVIWPKRAQVVNYSTVVFVTLVLLIVVIFVLNFAFSKAVLFLYK